MTEATATEPAAHDGIAAIVVSYRRPDLLGPCLASLERALDRVGGGQLVVVENGSGDGSPEIVRRDFPRATLVELETNRGFAAGVNEGLRHSLGEFVVLLNNDATVDPDALRELLVVGQAARDIASVAAQMRFAARPDTINSAGLEVDRLGVSYDRLVGLPVAESEEDPVEVFGSSGGAALFRRAALEEVGGFDESYFVFYEDADVAWRTRMRGWRHLYGPRAVVYHHHSSSASHGSRFKHLHVGRNRVRLLARNACASHLWRYGPTIVAYDLAYVTYAAVMDATLAPLQGRLRGLREWRAARGAVEEPRRPVELAPVEGLRAALRRRRAWARAGSSPGG